MSLTQHTNEEIARMAEDIYHRAIRDKVMPQHKGRFLVLDVESGDYEVSDDDLTGTEILHKRRPEGVFFLLRIGYTTAYTLAGTMEEEAA